MVGLDSGRNEVPVFNFILQPEFPLNALVLASDALRIANQNSGRELFSWNFVSEDGTPVRASNGMWISADCALANMPDGEVCLLFEGNLPTQKNSPKLLGHLRMVARYGAIVGSVDTGAFALAQAGLTCEGSEPEVVLHWEAVPTFVECFSDTSTLNQIYLVKDRRAYCAGGVATLDMMLELIAQFRGDALANEVANALVHTRREAATRQRGDSQMSSEQNQLADSIVSIMESNLDFPLGLEEIAAELDISDRTLTRACKRMFGQTPMRLYLHIRLQAARNLLFYEEFPIKDIAIACGFSYPAVFSRVFKSQFGQAPRDFRAVLRLKQGLAIRPEIRRLTARAPAETASQTQSNAAPASVFTPLLEPRH